jgi:hypothetical protein
MKALLTLALVIPLACCADPETGAAARDGYLDGGLLGAVMATTPEALAERKRKAELRAAYNAEVCERIAVAGSAAHSGCMLKMAEADARQVDAAHRASSGVMCHRFMDTITCH